MLDNKIQPTPKTRPWLPEILVFMLALVVRAICLWNFRQIPFFSHLIVDSKAYDAWGLRIAQGEWVSQRAFYQAPLYPYFIGIFYKLAGHHSVWLRLFQIVLGSAGCVVLLRAGQRFFDRTTGILTGVMLAVYAPAVFFDCLISKSVLDIVLLCLALWLVARAQQDGRPRQMLGVGVCIGLLTLTRENALLLAPIAALWLASPWKPAAQRWDLRAFAAVLLAFVAVLSPVYAHNALHGARTSITTYQAGTNFYIGNSANAEGGYVPIRDEHGTTELEESDARELAETAEGRALTPDEINRYWFRRAFADIAKQPGTWAALLVRKVLLTFNGIELVDTDDIYFYDQFSPVLRGLNSLWNFGLLFPLALAGAAACWPQRRKFAILLLFAAAMAASLVIFYVVARYRHVLSPMLIPVAAAGVVAMVRDYRSHRNGSGTVMSRRQRIAIVLMLVLGLTLARLPLLRKDEQLGTSYFNAAGSAWQEGQREAAERYFELAVKAGRTGPATQLNYGALLSEMGRHDAAMEAFRRAESEGAETALLEQNRGTADLRIGHFAEALQKFEAAERASTATAELENSRGVALRHMQKSAEARQAFETAIRLKPAYSKAYTNLARCLADAGETTAISSLLARAEATGVNVTEIQQALRKP